MCKLAFAVTKYHQCSGKLPAETVALKEDMVNNFALFADPYTELKQHLCMVYGRSDIQKVNDLLDLPNLGPEKTIGAHGQHFVPVA